MFNFSKLVHAFLYHSHSNFFVYSRKYSQLDWENTFFEIENNYLNMKFGLGQKYAFY